MAGGDVKDIRSFCKKPKELEEANRKRRMATLIEGSRTRGGVCAAS
jgi:hypothetical protein